jgi:3-hydroxyisobutyrate dehydrogenase-like beta-hydroxyacid dehydrogenase
MMIEGDFESAFALKYMQKDFDLVMEASHDLRTPLFTSAIAHQVYTAANVAGDSDLDYSSVVKFLEAAAAMQGQDS